MNTWKDIKGYERIEQRTKAGELIKVWNSINEAARGLQLYTGNISSCCAGRLQTTGGYKFNLL